MGATTEWHLQAARLALPMKRCNRVQPFCSGIFRRCSRKKSALSGICFFLVHLLLASAVLAPKRSKNAVFSVKHFRVQLILRKLVAPYLLC
ncbi:hypothetical protein EXW72_26445 [Pseudomonas sp. BCA14]|nr:hypothetical protein EXW71_26160 [Pseudomonas sp. BCA17]TFF05014.1 hypothetical protein EXW70_21865 [Pseudomonas sp. JMN1]TFF19060.1 hypothetical protein EXW72_26445 [Pseudomonas sp. BCA14]TFF26878.1 hypothetical protein EXW73_14715 [Pseudomonas sp. BCA13]